MDITPIINQWLVPFLIALGSGLTIWIVYHTNSWLDAHAQFLDSQQRVNITATEEKALGIGVDWVVNFAEREGAKVHPQVNSWLLRQGAQLAINHASGILADNGANPNLIANKILAFLPPSFTTSDVNQAIKLPPEYTAHVDQSVLPPPTNP
jgi:hypothetical protein